MKVLVATLRTQGAFSNDYSFCVPGELLWITEVCARDRRDPGQGCGADARSEDSRATGRRPPRR